MMGKHRPRFRFDFVAGKPLGETCRFSQEILRLTEAIIAATAAIRHFGSGDEDSAIACAADAQAKIEKVFTSGEGGEANG
ncbi:MAG: hypothetical protein SFU86_07485 [Pirellulaceae bacterium]|nr:hypothetical protein [Pirellulaceae bacterium]